jgi:hypothetical protein
MSPLACKRKVDDSDFIRLLMVSSDLENMRQLLMYTTMIQFSQKNKQRSVWDCVIPSLIIPAVRCLNQFLAACLHPYKLHLSFK